MRVQSVPSLFDRWFADFDEAFAAPVARPFRPVVDLIEYPDRYEVVADLPGVEQKQVEVEFNEGALEIRGERTAEAEPEEGRLLARERVAGRFSRRIVFRDEPDVEKIAASFRDGVLRVSVPKSDRHRPRQIEVEVH